MRPSASRLLANFLEENQQDRITVGDLVAALGHRGQAILLLLLALPNGLLLASIPGLSTIFGVPMCFIAMQMLVNRPSLWLPNRIRDQVIDRTTLNKILEVSNPYLVKIERYIKPRFQYFTYGFFEKIIGLSVLILSVIVTLPIPFGNFLGGWGVIILSLAIIERDGIMAIMGLTYTVLFSVIFYRAADALVTLILRWF